MPTDDVENPHSTNSGSLRLANKHELFSKNRKDITRGIEDLQYIDQHILKEIKMRRKYVTLAWIV